MTAQRSTETRPSEAISCPDCGAPVLPAGELLLTPQPTRLGLYAHDGTRLETGEVRDLVLTTGNAGHSPHTCNARNLQPPLFDPQEA